jgi:transcriptional regulator with XRE-family HTH domain
MASLGERLKLRLKEKKTNAVQVGRKLGIAPTAMYNVMLDRNKGMLGKNLTKIAVELDVNEEWLLHGKLPKLRRLNPDNRNWLIALNSLTEYQRKTLFTLIVNAQEELTLAMPSNAIEDKPFASPDARLRMRLTQLRMSPQELSGVIGLSVHAIHQLILDPDSGVQPESAAKLAQALNLIDRWQVAERGAMETPPSLKVDEAQFMANFRKLDPDVRSTLSLFVKHIVGEEKVMALFRAWRRVI